MVAGELVLENFGGMDESPTERVISGQRAVHVLLPRTSTRVTVVSKFLLVFFFPSPSTTRSFLHHHAPTVPIPHLGERQFRCEFFEETSGR